MCTQHPVLLPNCFSWLKDEDDDTLSTWREIDLIVVQVLNPQTNNEIIDSFRLVSWFSVT